MSKLFSLRRGSSRTAAGQTLYFAYGSNLSFDQIAKRCPGSRYVGRARLYSYLFQINQRGFANVVKVDDPQSYVEGLCYRLTAADELLLDRSEGVPNAYQKELLEVEFFPAPSFLLGRDVIDIVQNRDPISYYEFPDIGQDEASMAAAPLPGSVERGEAAFAMVYLSKTHFDDGQPWDEYIDRMRLGLQEAINLGISSAYVNRDVVPWLLVGRGVRAMPGGQPSPRKSKTGKKLSSRRDNERDRDRNRDRDREERLTSQIREERTEGWGANLDT